MLEATPRLVQERASRAYDSRRNVLALAAQQHLFPTLQGRAPETMIAQHFRASLDYQVAGDVVRVGYVASDPAEARRVVGALVELFVRARRTDAIIRARASFAAADAEFARAEQAYAVHQNAFGRFARANEGTINAIQGFFPHRGCRSGYGMPLRGSPRAELLRTRRYHLHSQPEWSSRWRTPSPADPADVRDLYERIRAIQLASTRCPCIILPPTDCVPTARELRSMYARLDAGYERFRAAWWSDHPPRSEDELVVAEIDREVLAMRAELSVEESAAEASLASSERSPTPRDPFVLDTAAEVEREFNRLWPLASTSGATYRSAVRPRLLALVDLRRAESLPVERIRVLAAPSLPAAQRPIWLAAIISLLAAVLALRVVFVSAMFDAFVRAPQLTRFATARSSRFPDSAEITMPPGSS